MPLSRLELVSSHGDQTLSRVRFVLHGTSSATDALSVLDAGLRFVEGRSILSTNIIYAHDSLAVANQALTLGDPGMAIILAVPPNYHLGYGIFTSAYIDRKLRRVSGAPVKYAAGRKQLALYMPADTEAARVHIEAEVANGYPLDQRPQYEIEPKYIFGSFPVGPAFDELAKQLDVSIRSLEPLQLERLETLMMDFIRVTEPANAVTAPTAIRDIITGTVESMVISRLRMMRWQGLKLLGYTFEEGDAPIEISTEGDLSEQHRRMDDLGRMLASSNLFSAELSWLKVYVGHELELMRVELEGAELESLPD
jgi:hypothetical protein